MKQLDWNEYKGAFSHDSHFHRQFVEQVNARMKSIDYSEEWRLTYLLVRFLELEIDAQTN